MWIRLRTFEPLILLYIREQKFLLEMIIYFCILIFEESLRTSDEKMPT